MKSFVLIALLLIGGPTMSADVEPTAAQTAQAIIKAPVAEVWKVFSTADGFKKLGVAHCEIDFRIGGMIRSHYSPSGELGDEGTIQNEILSFEPERMISIRIQKPPKGFPFGEETWKGTWSVISLSDLGDGRTHLRITGMGYPATEAGAKMRKFFEDGNGYTLKVLQRHFDSTAVRPTGPAHAPSPLAPISLERVVQLPREQVWKLYTTPEGWKQTMGAGLNVDLKPGGPFEVLFMPNEPKGKRGADGCTVLSFIPGQMISHTWNAPPKFAHARANHTWVVVHFDELTPTMTRIRLDHLGFAEKAAEFPEHRTEYEQVRAYFEQAWGKVLDGIKSKGVSS